MLDELSVQETYILSRYLYRMGQPILSDAVYDELHEYFVARGELTEYVTRTYDDDPVPYDLLQKIGLTSSASEKNLGRDTSFLAEDKSMSIRKVDNLQQVYDFCQKHKNQAFVVSIKMDGNNIKSEIEDGKLKLSLTRGRASNGIDVTDAMSRVLPERVALDGHRILVGEIFVPPRHLEFVRNKYASTDSNGDQTYKTAKSAAISFIRRPFEHDKADYSLLDFRVFACDGLSNTVVGAYQGLEELGFTVPPYRLVEEIPQEFDEFSRKMMEIMDDMYVRQQQLGLPADGLVMELNDLLAETEIKNQYDERQIAIKFYNWKAQRYTGVVTSIIIEQRRVMCCCKVTIENLITSDGCKATTINIFNPSYLVDAGIGVGSEIEFERQSGTVNILVNGKSFSTGDKDGD